MNRLASIRRRLGRLAAIRQRLGRIATIRHRLAVERATIPCPGCGAPCDSSAVGPHALDCPDYGENAPNGPEDYGHGAPEDQLP